MDSNKVEEKLKRYWKTNDLLLVAEYQQSKRNPKFGFFENFLTNDREIIYPKTEGIQYDRSILIHLPHNPKLKSGQNYGVKVKPARSNGTTNPYLVEIEEVFEVEYDGPREFIKKWFSRKGENPGDAATIASQLRLNELELYTQTERFVFELLQNADDMPTSGRKVNVRMELLEDYFLFLHDGKFFDRNDVMAIADAARSTKSHDKTKTGYKGIGFKSVFTDSSRVFIKSQSYSFKFDKLYPIYSDFWQLYGKYMEDSSERKRVEIRREYTGRESEFTQIDRIPWQIKPIWVEHADYPEVLRKSDVWARQNVSIALEIGQATFTEKQYDQKISRLLSEPRFLLFLRNITSVSYTHNDQKSTLALQSTGSLLEIRCNDELLATYIKWNVDITLTNESFAEAGLPFQKRELQEGKYEFVTQDGQQVKNIPEKLVILERSTLAFAAQFGRGQIKRIHKDEAILFNYLPTSDKRFAFPFLVNGDFVTKTDREHILHENLWNQYLFFHIGYAHIKWLNMLAQQSQFRSSYLNLLVGEPKDETHSSEHEINAAFNRGLYKAVAKLPFIRTLTNEVALPADIVLDETELAKILGNSFFHAFTGKSKQLPDRQLSPSILRREFLAIERFEITDLVDLLSQEESLKIFTSAVVELSDVRYKLFMEWLNAHCEKADSELRSLMPTLPILRFDSEIFSWSAIANQNQYLLSDNRTESLRSALKALDFTSSAINIDLFPAIKSALQAQDTYLNNDLLLYDKVSSRCGQYKLEPEQKANLFTFFVGLKQVGEEKYAKSLCLFADNSGTCRPLYKLLSRNIAGLPAWLACYKITEAEFNILPREASKHLVQQTNLFSKSLCDPAVLADCTKNLDSQHVSEWVTQLLQWRNREEPKTTESGLSALPWIYTDDTHRFRAASELWDHDALANVPAQAVIESLTGWLFPHTNSRPLIEQFALQLKSVSLTTGITHTDKILSENEIRLLIQYLEEALEATFLKKWTFLVAETGFKLSALSNKTVYVADEPIQSFIEASGLRESFVTVPAGLADTDTLAAIGAITGDTLLALLTERQAVLSLAPLLLKRADTQLYATYLQNLPALAISSTLATYTDQSPEVHVLRIAHDIAAGGNSTLFNSFLNKTTLDGYPISEIADFLPTVTVKNLVGKEPYKFSTAELLPNNAGRIERIQHALNTFSDCKLISQKFLRDQVFCSIELKADNAESEIHKSTPDFLSPVQLVFLQTLRQSKGETNPHFKTKNFYTYWAEKEGDEKAWPEVKEYLTLLYDSGLNTSYLPFGLDSYVTDPDYCFEESESLPAFFTKWADTDDKLLFLTQLDKGANGSDSNVVKLRKALLEGDNIAAKSLVRTVEKPLLINTLKWLRNKQDDKLTTACIESIDEILKNVAWPLDQSPVVPVITGIREQGKMYQLAEFTKQVVHTWSESWKPYEQHVLGMLVKQGAWIVENTFPVELDNRIGKLDTIEPIRKLAKDIQVGALLLSEPCYEAWEGKADYPIYRIAGHKIPWQIWYGETLIADIEEEDRLYDDETAITYLTAESIKNFPRNLPGNFPEVHKNILYELAWKLREHPEEDTRSQTKFYTPEFERIIGGDELNDEQQGKEFKSAILRGVPYLEEQGFDFRECTVSTGLHFLNVRRDGFKTLYNITFRSARRGLLYLNLGAWKRLGINNEVLIVVYEGGEMRMFSSKEELLSEKWNEYMLYRVEKPANIDEKYAGITLDDKTTHLLFVTNEKMYKSLYQDKLAQKTNKSVDAATANKNDLG